MKMTVAKKKRVSKKTKSAWRKHVDIGDVEDYLEDLRHEERMGAPLSTLTNEELFKVDTGTEEVILTSKQQKRQQLRDKPLKHQQLLKPHTNVPDPITKRNRVKSKEEKQKGIAKFINKKLEARAKRPKQIRKVEEETDDVWENFCEDDSMAKEIKTNQWFNDETQMNLLLGSSKKKKVMPNTMKNKAAVVESVQLPHPGTSYNPSYEDHKNLMDQVIAEELKIIKEEEHLARVTTKMYAKSTVQEKESNWLVEMSEGLKPDNENEEIDDSGRISLNPPTENKKKNKQQRRKQQEEKILRAQRIIAKKEKRKGSDLNRLRAIQKSIESLEAKNKELFEKKQKLREKKSLETKRLARLKFEAGDIDFNRGDEIAGNLRNLKKGGSVLGDRFKSLQMRNIIPPTEMSVRKKAKVKRFEKIKGDWKKTVARPGFI